jgi:hypothetical protein
MKWFSRFANTWKNIDDLESRVKAIETDIINKRVDEANQKKRPPPVTLADDTGTLWFTIRD